MDLVLNHPQGDVYFLINNLTVTESVLSFSTESSHVEETSQGIQEL